MLSTLEYGHYVPWRIQRHGIQNILSVDELHQQVSGLCLHNWTQSLCAVRAVFCYNVMTKPTQVMFESWARFLPTAEQGLTQWLTTIHIHIIVSHSLRSYLVVDIKRTQFEDHSLNATEMRIPDVLVQWYDFQCIVLERMLSLIYLVCNSIKDKQRHQAIICLLFVMLLWTGGGCGGCLITEWGHT